MGMGMKHIHLWCCTLAVLVKGGVPRPKCPARYGRDTSSRVHDNGGNLSMYRFWNCSRLKEHDWVRAGKRKHLEVLVF